ncbi:hypothetical protein BDW22DRAFT_1325780, partial [Trametopsis cervina]
RHFTWAWHTVIMGTGIISSVIQNFPYHNGSMGLKIMTIFFFLLNLVLFVFVITMTILRYVVYPKVWSKMIAHPAHSLFIGALPMGIATLLNAGAVSSLHMSGGIASKAFIWTLWAFWWVDSGIAILITFGMLYAMMEYQEHSISTSTTAWLIPTATLVVVSSTGGLMANALKEQSHTIALVTSGFALGMLLIGLSFTFIFMCVYATRLITSGIPNASLILSSFITLGPLGQGGFSLLVNGQNFADLLVFHIPTSDPPLIANAGQMVFAACFVGAYALWATGIAWIIIACIAVWHVRREHALPFNMAYWGLVFPFGTFALLSLQFGKVLDSGFFRAFGTFWSVVVWLLWLFVFVRSIPSFIDGSMFLAPYLVETTPPAVIRSSQQGSRHDLEKAVQNGGSQGTLPANAQDGNKDEFELKLEDRSQS